MVPLRFSLFLLMITISECIGVDELDSLIDDEFDNIVAQLSPQEISMMNSVLEDLIMNQHSSPTSYEESISQICGRRYYRAPRRKSRIVGGRRSDYSEWPWMISTRRWNGHKFVHKCSATLLNQRWAITAAHCLLDTTAGEVLLKIGEYEIGHPQKLYGYVNRRVKLIIRHPGFNHLTLENDLALMRLHQPVTFEGTIVPVCLPKNSENYVGRVGIVAGWGKLDRDGPQPKTLHHVSLPIVDNHECIDMYMKAGYREHIPDTFICAGLPQGGKDSCDGDSGGPLVIEENGQWFLVGIISWGIGCALPNQPGVYTRISEYSEWIHSIIVY
ncbi:trypsin-1-like isoform X1 [Brevipalpus obovatus]|uniref:trypsin-1-like isoform X1 n=1 Tax=Brevipalpus obovatus TaxID=246614 RepID=UPI003D9E4F5F